MAFHIGAIGPAMGSERRPAPTARQVVSEVAFGVWRLAFGVWRLAFGVRGSAFGGWGVAVDLGGGGSRKTESLIKEIKRIAALSFARSTRAPSRIHDTACTPVW